MEEKKIKYAQSFKEQLTVRGLIIGSLGAVVITTSSMYVALRLGALPWPTIFVAVASMGLLKLVGNTNINEINVTHTTMSAGAMVAGGVAFTLPGIWIRGLENQIHPWQLIVVVLGGVLMGMIFMALTRKYFIEELELPYPMGIAAAETLIAGDEGGKKGILLGITMVAATVFVILRDWFLKIPGQWLSKGLMAKGIPFGFWVSPMAIAIGYIIGPLFTGVWFIGSIIGFFGIVMLFPQFGWADATTAEAIRQSLGIGIMVGTGIGILLKGIIPKAKQIFGPMFSRKQGENSIINLRWAPFALALVVLVFTIVLKVNFFASVILIVGVWLATSMSAQITGQTGINPMEIFAIIVLLVAKIAVSSALLPLFFIAGAVAVACGLSGDVLNDFKAGYILKSSPKAQWISQCVGAVIGAFVAIGVLFIMVAAFGKMGTGTDLPAPQAEAVSALIGGLPHVPAFWIGLAIGAVLYMLGVPVMTLGLGVYLPMYLSVTIFIGGALRFIVNKVAPKWSKKDTGTIVAAGLLGGEGIAGVGIAIVKVVQGLF